MKKQISGFASVILFLAIACFSSTLAQALSSQTVKREDDSELIKALLSEVRELRMTLQRNSVTSYRAQITLERLRLQQTRVEALAREQREVQSSIKNAEQAFPISAEDLIEVERVASAAATPAERAQKEMEMKMMKKMIERGKQEAQDLRQREAQIILNLQTEQAKLNELNDRLEELERELEASASSEKTKRKTP